MQQRNALGPIERNIHVMLNHHDRHLARNGVDISGYVVTLGPWLTFDPKSEKFVGNEDANAIARGKYREPFVVPAKV